MNVLLINAGIPNMNLKCWLYWDTSQRFCYSEVESAIQSLIQSLSKVLCHEISDCFLVKPQGSALYQFKLLSYSLNDEFL